MSVPYQAGRDSSEHWRALRAEVFGGAVVLAGLIVAMWAAGRESVVAGAIGVGLCAVGAWALAHVAVGYAHARAAPKAAAVRRPADQAPRI